MEATSVDGWMHIAHYMAEKHLFGVLSRPGPLTSLDPNPQPHGSDKQQFCCMALTFVRLIPIISQEGNCKHTVLPCLKLDTIKSYR